MKARKLAALFYVLIIMMFVQVSCDKMGSTIPPPPPPDPCLVTPITLNGTVVNPSTPGASNGSIIIAASGGTGFSFSMNGSSPQTANSFNNLKSGDYTVLVKNSNGCTSSIDLRLTDPVITCSSVNIVVFLTATDNVLCEPSNGTISITSTGGVAPYTYSVDGGAYTSSNIITGMPTGSHMVMAKDANGCIGAASITINNASAGSHFAQVRTLIQNHCVYCHSNSSASGGVSYSNDCNIVTGQARIKARAVDGVPTAMPSTGLLSASERQKILDWISAGGRYSD